MSIYIKIAGIEGESKDSKHTKWIDAFSAGYGVSQSAAMSSGGGGGVGKADFGNFSFTHLYDRASPALFKYCASGKHIDTVEVSVVKVTGNGTPEEYLNIKLTDAIVTSAVPSGSEDALWTELVSIAYSKIDIAYREQKEDGTFSGAVPGGWNVKENKESA